MSEQYEHDLQVENRALKIEQLRLKTLITELCDAIPVQFTTPQLTDLLRRAREATK